MTAEYLCGCTFEDSTPLDGVIIPAGVDSGGQSYPESTLSKRISFSHGVDETDLFKIMQRVKREHQAGTLDREDLIRLIERLLRRNLTPTQKNFIRNASLPQIKNKVYDELIEVPYVVPRVVAEVGAFVTIPEIPSSCPRHDEPIFSVHSSHLNPGA